MLKATDFTEMVVNIKVMEKIREVLKGAEDKTVDFRGTVILEYTHEKIAEMVVMDGMIPKNIVEGEDRDKIDYYRRELLQPRVDGVGKFIAVFKKRFKPGDVCILDRTLQGLKTNENRRSIIMIEKYNDDKKTIDVRVYFSGKAQPKYFRECGGYNSRRLYRKTELDLISLYNKELLVEHPRDEVERKVLDILFSIK